MVKETPVGPPIDRSNRSGNPILLLLVTLAVLGAALALIYLDGPSLSLFLIYFLAAFAALGVLFAFLFAIGTVQFAGRAARNDITKAIVDGSNEAQLVVDRDGTVLYANAAYQALCGGTTGRVASIRPVERLFSGSPEVSEATYRLAQAAREGRSATETMRLVPALTGGGGYAWYRVRVRPLRRGNGSVVQHWNVSDATREYERHENEFQELQEAISYLDHAPAGFIAARPEGRIVYLNATLADWLDLDLAEIADRPLALNDIVSGEGAALLAAVSGNPGAVRTETIDLDLKRRNGQTLPVRMFHRVAFASDGTPGISRTLVLNRSGGRDVSDDLRAAEVKFARFFHNSPLAIATLGANGSIESSNARLASLVPTGSGAADIFTLVAEKDRSRLEAALKQAIEGKGEIAPVDADLAVPGGRTARFYVVSAETRVSEEAAALVYLLETTAEKKLQEQFTQSQKMNAIGQLAGGVAHDFNNHLQAITGFADLLIPNFRATDPRHQDLMQIKHSANRAKSLVQKLLAYSRQQTLLPVTLDVGEQLSEINNMLKRTIGPNVELEIRHGRDLWPVHADPSSFDNMIINLAVNARDAMPQGGKLIVQTENVPAAESARHGVEGMPEGEYVQIEVTDNGTGMKPEVRQRIFEPFYTTKEVGKGTGLGLSSIYGFLQQSGGYIACQSEEGKGTTFRIFLPRRHAAEPTLAAAEAPVSSLAPVADLSESADRAPLADLTGKGLILLVEDDDAVRNFGARSLRSKGYTVLEAHSGVDALEKVEGRIDEIDLVVSDVVMPEMDGPSLLRELRLRKPEVRVIFVSGYAEEAFRRNLPEGEQFDFLPKPFSLKQLVETVKQVMG